MTSHDVDKIHEFYTDTPRHWSPTSEKYTGGHSLLTALKRGWVISDKIIFLEPIWKGVGRPIQVYYIKLQRDNEGVIMSIVDSPFVRRLVKQLNLRVVSSGIRNKPAVAAT